MCNISVKALTESSPVLNWCSPNLNFDLARQIYHYPAQIKIFILVLAKWKSSLKSDYFSFTDLKDGLNKLDTQNVS